MKSYSHSVKGIITVAFNQYLKPISDYISDNITLETISNE